METKQMTVKAYAKINLFLDILARLDTGYHSLFMYMQSIDLFDRVTLRKAEAMRCTCDNRKIPSDERNIAYKAAKAFFQATGIDGAVQIHIEKHIPSAAGLAGGSADGAAVLQGLNRLYDVNLPHTALCRIGAKVGADIPFCIMGGSMLAQNIGDVLSPLPDLPDCWIVLVKPGCDVSTAAAYAQADACRTLAPLDRIRFLSAAAAADLDGICRYAGNVFEQVVEVPGRVKIKKIMREHNAALAQMSGSGPSVFGLFLQEADAVSCIEALKTLTDDVFLCRPTRRGTSLT